MPRRRYHGAQVADPPGPGPSDPALLVLGGIFHIFENQAADQDVLVAVSDGMNAHDPEDPGFVPNVSISYGHMTDEWMMNGASPSDPKRESYLYLSRADAGNDCAYPRKCAVGSRRVVSGYAVNNGADKPRHFDVRYRDGRYHRRRGFLGFAQRIVTDLDTGAATADFYDNITVLIPLVLPLKSANQTAARGCQLGGRVENQHRRGRTAQRSPSLVGRRGGRHPQAGAAGHRSGRP